MWHERLGTILIVIALTGLIWFFADRANKDSRTIKVLVSVQPASSVVVLGREPQSLEFEVTVSAPRGVISEIEKETQGQPLRANLPLDENVGTGWQKFRSDTTLARLDVIQQRGLSIVSVKPETFRLDIDKIVTQTGVRIKPQFPGLTVDSIECTPSVCSVSLPSRLVEGLSGESLPVDASRNDPAQPGTGGAISKTVTLQWPTIAGGAEQYVHFEPATFNLKYRLNDKTKVRLFESVQVRLDIPPDVASKYQVVQMDLGDWRPSVTVSGPEQRINTLEKPEIQLFVSITSEDVGINVGKPIPRQVWVILPPGIKLEGPRPEVKFILQDRPMTASTGG